MGQFMITVNRKDFAKVSAAKPGTDVKIVGINDIISSTPYRVHAEKGTPHEMNRRVVQIAKALKSNSHSYYEGVGARLRCDSRVEPIAVRVMTVHSNGDDDCTFNAVVVK